MACAAAAVLALILWPRKVAAGKGGGVVDPKNPDIHPIDPVPGSGDTLTICPMCGKQIKHKNGTMLPTHPPCPWPYVFAPVKPGKDDVIIVKPKPDDPKPEEPKGPDPYKPTPTPTPGSFYQVKKGDTGSANSYSCYPGRPKPTLTWIKVMTNPANAWLLGHIYYGSESGAYMPNWSGWGSKWQTGHQYGVVYFPTVAELDA